MSRYTIFEFTLPTGRAGDIYFEEDFVGEAKIVAGTRLQLIPKGETFSVLLDPSPVQEVGIPYRVMALVAEQVRLRTKPALQDAWVLHLATEATSVSYH